MSKPLSKLQLRTLRALYITGNQNIDGRTARGLASRGLISYTVSRSRASYKFYGAVLTRDGEREARRFVGEKFKPSGHNIG